VAVRYGIVNGQVVPLPPTDPSLPAVPVFGGAGINAVTMPPPIQLPPVPRYTSPQLFINQVPERPPSILVDRIPEKPSSILVDRVPERPPSILIDRIPERPGTRVDASTSAEDRRLARMGLEQRQRINASTSGTAEPDFRVQWTPKPVEVSPADVAKYGPNAAGVKGIISSAGSLSEEAAKIANDTWDAAKGDTRRAAWNAAGNAAHGAALGAARGAAGGDAMSAARGAVRGAAYGAAEAEVVADKITPEQYKLLTNPLAVGVTYDRILNSLPENDRGSFRSAVMAAKPTSPEQVQQIANLPRRAMDNLGSLKGDMSFDRKISAVSRVNRAMPADRAEREANRSKAVREVK